MRVFAYTMGNPKSYEEGFRNAFEDGSPLMKVGRTDDYEGGIVFETVEDARSYIENEGLTYEVYGLVLENGWSDVEWQEGYGYGLLLRDSRILRGPTIKTPFGVFTQRRLENQIWDLWLSDESRLTLYSPGDDWNLLWVVTEGQSEHVTSAPTIDGVCEAFQSWLRSRIERCGHLQRTLSKSNSQGASWHERLRD